MPKNGGGGGLGQFVDLRRRLGKKERGGVFKGGGSNWKDKIITISLLSFPKKVTQ